MGVFWNIIQGVCGFCGVCELLCWVFVCFGWVVANLLLSGELFDMFEEYVRIFVDFAVMLCRLSEVLKTDRSYVTSVFVCEWLFTIIYEWSFVGVGLCRIGVWTVLVYCWSIILTIDSVDSIKAEIAYVFHVYDDLVWHIVEWIRNVSYLCRYTFVLFWINESFSELQFRHLMQYQLLSVLNMCWILSFHCHAHGSMLWTLFDVCLWPFRMNCMWYTSEF